MSQRPGRKPTTEMSKKNTTTIDRKFTFTALNPVNGNIYTEDTAFIMCAKDAAVPAALKAYHDECVRLKCNPHHIASIELMIDRVREYQQNIERRIPDTVGEETVRCICGILSEKQK